jgi:hypothetical protein
VAAELGEHLKDGRLDTAEFDERVGQAVTAKTRGDLDRLLADLPRPDPGPPSTPARRSAWPLALAPVAFLVILMAVASVAGHVHGAPAGWAGGAHPGWALWWFSWWLIPIAIFSARRLLRGRGPQHSGGAESGR